MSTATIPPQYALAFLQASKKGLDAAVARDETEPGVYRDIKMTVEIEVNEMRVAPDTDKAPTSSIPWTAVTALLLQRMGVQRDGALDILRNVMNQALNLDKDATKTLMEEYDVKGMEKRLKEEVIAELPRVPVKGAVKVDKDAVKVTVKSMTMQG